MWYLGTWCSELCVPLPVLSVWLILKLHCILLSVLSAGVEWAGWTSLERTVCLFEKNLSFPFSYFLSQVIVIFVYISKIPIYCLYNNTSLFIFRVSLLYKGNLSKNKNKLENMVLLFIFAVSLLYTG